MNQYFQPRIFNAVDDQGTGAQLPSPPPLQDADKLAKFLSIKLSPPSIFTANNEPDFRLEQLVSELQFNLPDQVLGVLPPGLTVSSLPGFWLAAQMSFFDKVVDIVGADAPAATIRQALSSQDPAPTEALSKVLSPLGLYGDLRLSVEPEVAIGIGATVPGIYSRLNYLVEQARSAGKEIGKIIFWGVERPRYANDSDANLQKYLGIDPDFASFASIIRNGNPEIGEPQNIFNESEAARCLIEGNRHTKWIDVLQNTEAHYLTVNLSEMPVIMKDEKISIQVPTSEHVLGKFMSDPILSSLIKGKNVVVASSVPYGGFHATMLAGACAKSDLFPAAIETIGYQTELIGTLATLRELAKLANAEAVSRGYNMTKLAELRRDAKAAMTN